MSTRILCPALRHTNYEGPLIGTHLGVSSALIDTFVSLRPFIGPFLDRCERDVDWSRYTIVGFTSMFEQNLPTLALASRIKAKVSAHMHCHGRSQLRERDGEQLHKSFPFLDYVFAGQSDWSFPQFVEHIMTNRPVDAIRGLVHRRDGASVSTGRPESVGDLNRLPVPDYDDYVTQLGAYQLLGKLPVRLQFETSRGCWWGMKQHCTFCGFNAETMQFGAKSPDRVVDELEYLASRYNTTDFDAVDNILDYRAFATVLPRLAERKPPFSLFYEIKSNLRRDQVRMLGQAGVRSIQPGIESLNTQVLGVMKKGLTALQNIQVLKWCREFAILPSWNLIYGFPDELPEAYAEMASIMRWLHHLPAPRGSGKIRLDRFSPHWSNPEAFGLQNVRPLQVYRYLYPLRDDERRRIAYFFEYDYAEPRDVRSYTEAADRAINEWRAAETAGAALIVDDAGESAKIKDTRVPGVTKEFRLDGWKAYAYRILDQVRPRASLVAGIQESPHGAPSEAIIDSFLASCVESGLMLQEQDRYLALAVRNDLTRTITNNRRVLSQGVRMSTTEENAPTKGTTTDRYELHVIRETGQVVRLTRVDEKGEHDVPLPYPVYATGFVSREAAASLRDQYEAVEHAVRQYWRTHAEVYGSMSAQAGIQPGIGAAMEPAIHPGIGAGMGPAISPAIYPSPSINPGAVMGPAIQPGIAAIYDPSSLGGVRHVLIQPAVNPHAPSDKAEPPTK